MHTQRHTRHCFLRVVRLCLLPASDQCLVERAYLASPAEPCRAAWPSRLGSVRRAGGSVSVSLSPRGVATPRPFPRRSGLTPAPQVNRAWWTLRLTTTADPAPAPPAGPVIDLPSPYISSGPQVLCPVVLKRARCSFSSLWCSERVKCACADSFLSTDRASSYTLRNPKSACFYRGDFRCESGRNPGSPTRVQYPGVPR